MKISKINLKSKFALKTSGSSTIVTVLLKYLRNSRKRRNSKKYFEVLKLPSFKVLIFMN